MKKIKKLSKPLIFAPLEGITDPLFRYFILRNYNHWDYYFTDFFRIPTCGKLQIKHIINHIGTNIYNSKSLLNKTILQILLTERTPTIEATKLINDLNLSWLDLNFGCPSKHVNKHGGGAILMDKPSAIKNIVRATRQNFHGFLSVKIRLGVNTDDNFLTVLKIFNDEGVDLVTIHPRYKIDMYKGVSNWNYITIAKKYLSIPVIGNGDIKSIDDINKMYKITNCDGIMIGRGAIQSPWLAENHKSNFAFSRKKASINFFLKLINYLQEISSADHKILIRMKSLSHYLFYDQIQLKESLVRCQHYSKMKEIIINS